ncbi:conserved hypothetical protein [Trichinella spiralis]|uniref:hypothetical protein n=1 Tax=Trichinella spiralis TaxID=6334 RepID=UPI0001EFC5C4|nr:conserved hypothetical protein [Trichinella spiralis]
MDKLRKIKNSFPNTVCKRDNNCAILLHKHTHTQVCLETTNTHTHEEHNATEVVKQCNQNGSGGSDDDDDDDDNFQPTTLQRDCQSDPCESMANPFILSNCDPIGHGKQPLPTAVQLKILNNYSLITPIMLLSGR